MNRTVRIVVSLAAGLAFGYWWCPLVRGEVVYSAWYGNGGESDRSIATATNWNGSVVPDLTGGTSTPNFLGGKGADLNRSVWFLGVRLVAKNFALTASSPDAVAMIGAGGVETVGNASKRSYTWEWPTVLKVGQVWNVKNVDELNVMSRISSEGSVRWTLGGSGTNNLFGSLSLPGVVAVTNGTVNLSSTDLVAGDSLEVDAVNARLNLNGATLKRDVKNVTEANRVAVISIAAGTANTVNGNLDLSVQNETEVAMGAGSTLTLTGRLRRRGENWLRFTGSSEAQSTCSLDGPIDAEPGVVVSVGAGVELCLNAAGNAMGGAKLWLSSNTSRLRTTQRLALSADDAGRRVTVRFGSYTPTWDLAGCDQEIAALESNGRATVTSETEAVLRIVGGNVASSLSETIAAVFAGAAGLSFAGGGRLVLTSESSTQGALEVTGGELILQEGARWERASAARAAGGRLTVGDRAAFGRQTEVSVSNDGQVALEYTGFMRIGRLLVDGQAKPAGTYGAVGSGAMHELTCLTGTGRLHVGMVGLMGIVK